jgi:hypothetical protein
MRWGGFFSFFFFSSVDYHHDAWVLEWKWQLLPLLPTPMLLVLLLILASASRDLVCFDAPTAWDTCTKPPPSSMQLFVIVLRQVRHSRAGDQKKKK